MRCNALLLGTAIVATAVYCAQPAPASTLINMEHNGLAMTSHSSRGYLGVGVREVAEDQMNGFHMPAARGLEIVLIDHDAPAAKAGLKEHDVILRANGELVENVDKFRRIVRETPPGHLLALVISRDGVETTIPVKVADRGEVEKQAWSQHMTVIPESDMDMSMVVPNIGRTVPGSGFFATIVPSSYYTGVIVDALGPQLASFFGAQSGLGLLVKSVDVNSPASKAGIRAGDVITKVGATQMATRMDFYKAVRENKGKQITITLLRDKKEQTVTLDIGGGKGNKSRIEMPDLPEMVEMEQMNAAEEQMQMAELQPEIEAAIANAEKFQTEPEMDKVREQMKQLEPKLREEMKGVQEEMRKMEPQLREQMKALQPQIEEQMKALQPQIEEQMKQLQQIEPQIREQMQQFRELEPKLREQMKSIEPQVREQLKQMHGLCTPLI